MSDLSDSRRSNQRVSQANPALSLTLAIGAGLVTWGFIHFHDPNGDGLGFFRVDEKYHIRGLNDSDERWAVFLEQQARVDLENAALVIGILGTALGASLAVCVPSRQLFDRRLLLGAGLGTLVGVVAGIAGCLLQQRFQKLAHISVEQSAYINSLLFGTLGLGLGAIVGGWMGSARRIVERGITGLVVGVLAGIAYPMIAYFAMATVNIEPFIPRVTAARVLWLGVATSMLGLILPWTNSKPKPHTLEPSQPMTSNDELAKS